MTLPKTAAAARAQNAKQYFTGRPCIRGHVAPRWTRNHDCLACAAEKYPAKRLRVKDQQNARNRERYANDPEYRARIHARKTPDWYERAKVRRRERYRTDPEYREKLLAPRRGRDQRDSSLRFRHGITQANYEEILALQGGVCAICRHKYPEALCVDHDHRTGVLRGLLCQRCNRGLGLLRDDEDVLARAIEYLRRWD